MVSSPYLVTPGKKFRLADASTDDTFPFKEKDDAHTATADNVATLRELQEVFYAEAKRALLVVVQAMDTGGKDGAIKHVFHGVDPQGCQVTSFKVPSAVERSHDALWRHHLACPGKGIIGIHNRSHYETVLVERVKDLAPKGVWSKRYEHINAFERMLADEGTVIVKFFLHISKDEQKRRLEARLKDPHKNWKFNPGDLVEREHWADYQDAYEDALNRCSTEWAPWYVIPADKKWFRNWAVSDLIVKTLKELKPQYPKPVAGLEKIVVK
jgi:PPK2 family polyphosphate:nucleotide phosphotransferase